jgi:hypothetical protein
VNLLQQLNCSAVQRWLLGSETSWECVVLVIAEVSELAEAMARDWQIGDFVGNLDKNNLKFK